MKKIFKNSKEETARWVEAEKIYSALEAIGYEVVKSTETPNCRPSEWHGIQEKVWEVTFLRKENDASGFICGACRIRNFDS